MQTHLEILDSAKEIRGKTESTSRKVKSGDFPLLGEDYDSKVPLCQLRSSSSVENGRGGKWGKCKCAKTSRSNKIWFLLPSTGVV